MSYLKLCLSRQLRRWLGFFCWAGGRAPTGCVFAAIHPHVVGKTFCDDVYHFTANLRSGGKREHSLNLATLCIVSRRHAIHVTTEKKTNSVVTANSMCHLDEATRVAVSCPRQGHLFFLTTQSFLTLLHSLELD